MFLFKTFFKLSYKQHLQSHTASTQHSQEIIFRSPSWWSFNLPTIFLCLEILISRKTERVSSHSTFPTVVFFSSSSSSEPSVTNAFPHASRSQWSPGETTRNSRSSQALESLRWVPKSNCTGGGGEKALLGKSADRHLHCLRSWNWDKAVLFLALGAVCLLQGF